MPLIAFLFIIAIAVWAVALTRVRIPVEELKRFSVLHLGALLVLLVGSVFGYDFFNISKGPIPITFDRLLLGALLAIAGGAWLINAEDIRRPNALDIGIVCLLGMLFFSMATHDFKYANNLPLSRLLFFYCLPFALYCVVRNAKLNKTDLIVITTALGVFAVYLALTGLAEIKGLYSVVFPRYIVDSPTTEFLGRGRGPFLNPVSNGIFLVAGFCCIWFWWPQANQRVRALIVAASIIIVAGIYATLTRSVWMTLIIVVGIGLWITTNRSQKGGLIIAATLMAVMLVPVVGDKLTSFKRDKEVSVEDMAQSAQLRPLFLSVAMRMFEDRPLLGCGFGQYAREKTPYLQDAYSGEPLRQTKNYLQHNVFLAYLTELGITGLAVLLMMLGLMARNAWIIWINRTRSIEERQIGFLLAAILICYCGNGMFHDTSIIPQVHYLLFFVAGLANNIRTGQVFDTSTATRVPTSRLPERGFPAAN